MATTKVSFVKDTWKLISTVSVSFQNVNKHALYVVEALSLPTDISIRNIITPLEWYSFVKNDGNLYGYSPLSSADITINPIV